jgi:hypothetical protein
MAKQKGVIILEGKLGGIVFYNGRYGNQARMNHPMSKAKYRKSPTTKRRRDTANQFGYAARMGKLLRHGVRRCLPHVLDGSLNSRLAGFITTLLSQDKTNGPGERRITADNVGLLKGFNWMEAAPLGSIIESPYSITLDADAGTASLLIDEVVAVRDIKARASATHVEISLVLVGADYEKDNFKFVAAVSGKIAVESDEVMAIELSCALDGFNGGLLVAGIGVQGWELSDGVYSPLKEGNGFEIGEAVSC